MEFAEIQKDPFTNTSSNYFLVVDIGNHPFPKSSSGGFTFVYAGILNDTKGNTVGFFYAAASYDYNVAGSLSDEAYAHSYITKRDWMLVPPGFQIESHTVAIGFWLLPKEVEQFILGRLSLKGGD